MTASTPTSTHAVRIETRDGQTLSFECVAGESVLDAAARNGITLAAMCRGGSCGTCRGRATDGPYRLGEHSPAALPPAAAEQGEVLLCRTVPLGPLTLRIEQDAAAVTAGPVPLRDATVATLEFQGGEVVRLQLKLEPGADGDASASFEPGQYAELILPDRDVTRAYSMANTPNWEGVLEFYIRLQPGGRFAEWLRQADTGDRLQVRVPNGTFTLDESRLAPRWFVAGGTGLAPVLSMLRWLGELQSPQPARLYFGLNREADRFAEEALAELASLLPDFRAEICLWRPETQWEGFVGTPVAALERDLVALAGGPTPDIYICGPPGLVEATEQLAHARGIDPSQLHSERFLPA